MAISLMETDALITARLKKDGIANQRAFRNKMYAMKPVAIADEFFKLVMMVTQPMEMDAQVHV